MYNHTNFPACVCYIAASQPLVYLLQIGQLSTSPPSNHTTSFNKHSAPLPMWREDFHQLPSLIEETFYIAVKWKYPLVLVNLSSADDPKAYISYFITFNNCKLSYIIIINWSDVFSPLDSFLEKSKSTSSCWGQQRTSPHSSAFVERTFVLTTSEDIGYVSFKLYCINQRVLRTQLYHCTFEV